jgi:hypothetical protein
MVRHALTFTLAVLGYANIPMVVFEDHHGTVVGTALVWIWVIGTLLIVLLPEAARLVAADREMAPSRRGSRAFTFFRIWSALILAANLWRIPGKL